VFPSAEAADAVFRNDRIEKKGLPFGSPFALGMAINTAQICRLLIGVSWRYKERIRASLGRCGLSHWLFDHSIAP
jgi:hypothetical protein